MESKKYFCTYAMLIDDNSIDNFVNQANLKTSRFAQTMKVFQYAEDALAALWADEQVPDYIFLDIHLPLKNGFDFLEELQTMPERYSHIKVVILTASPHIIDKLKAESYSQIVKYIGKPLDQKHLLELRMSIVTQKL